jgi:archaellum component FlaF (FlaF/FlaG flagellin family)
VGIKSTTAGNYISIAALLVSLIMMYVTTSNNKKNQNRAENSDKKVDEKQIKEETVQQTSIMIALDNIKSMLSDIKGEVNAERQAYRDAINAAETELATLTGGVSDAS